MTTSNGDILSVTHLTKYFPVKSGLLQRVNGQVKAVDDISFTIREGETLGLVGESGCGKTTAARTILQLEEPTAGSVKLKGQELVHLDRREMQKMRTQMQIIFQNPYSSLNPRMTIGRILTEPMLVHGIAATRKERRARGRVATTCRLSSYSSTLPRVLRGHDNASIASPEP